MCSSDLAPRLIDKPIRWRRQRRLDVRGALVHAMGAFLPMPSGEISAHEFLRRSPELTGSSVCAHRLLHPDGSITVCVPDDKVTFHAGESQFGELRNLNETFLGMEWLVAGVWEYGHFVSALRGGEIDFSDEQYESGGWQYAQWMMEHKFGRDRIAAHSAVAGDDVRGPGLGKHDPGRAFSWRHLQEQITIHLEAAEYIG